MSQQQSQQQDAKAFCNVPTIEGETRPYWEGCKRHELMLQHCKSCGSYQHPPRGFCGECYKMDLEWQKNSGKGTVWTYTVTYRNQDPGFRHLVPYVMAYVELEEGIKMMTNIVDCDPESVRIGMPVEVTFEDVNDEITIPHFKPRS